MSPIEGRNVPLYYPESVKQVIGFGSSSFIGLVNTIPPPTLVPSLELVPPPAICLDTSYLSGSSVITAS